MLIELGIQTMTDKTTKEEKNDVEEQRIKDHYESLNVPDPDDSWIEEDNLGNQSVSELLALHAAVMEELRARDVLRTANNPTGDLAEYLFCSAFGWEQKANSAKAFDATGDDGTRYQIKGRRIHRRNKSRQLSAIRNLGGFDILAAVLFDDDYRVTRAALIPAEVVRNHSTYTEHTNSYRFLLRDGIWDAPGVIDVTDRLNIVVL
jgi:hypothetical protein